MVTYLLHDDELSIESDRIFAEAERRLTRNSEAISELQINSDDELVEAIDGQVRIRSQCHVKDDYKNENPL